MVWRGLWGKKSLSNGSALPCGNLFLLRFSSHPAGKIEILSYISLAYYKPSDCGCNKQPGRAKRSPGEPGWSSELLQGRDIITTSRCHPLLWLSHSLKSSGFPLKCFVKNFCDQCDQYLIIYNDEMHNMKWLCRVLLTSHWLRWTGDTLTWSRWRVDRQTRHGHHHHQTLHHHCLSASFVIYYLT